MFDTMPTTGMRDGLPVSHKRSRLVPPASANTLIAVRREFLETCKDHLAVMDGMDVDEFDAFVQGCFENFPAFAPSGGGHRLLQDGSTPPAFTCSCAAGWGGERCEDRIHDVLPNIFGGG